MAIWVDVQRGAFGTVATLGPERTKVPIPRGGHLTLESAPDEGVTHAVVRDAADQPVGPPTVLRPATLTRGRPPA